MHIIIFRDLFAVQWPVPVRLAITVSIPEKIQKKIRIDI